MPTGTPIVIGFYPTTDTVPSIDERLFNEGVPYADEAEVFATLDEISRAVYLPVNIAGVEYWFYPDIYTLAVKNVAQSNTADNINITDTGEYFDSTEVESALQEIGNALLVLSEALTPVKSNPYEITMPTGDLVTKIAGAVFSPVTWATCELSGGSDLLITHTLTGRKVSFVNVFEIDGSNEHLLSFDKGEAYTGITGNGLTVLISGLANTSLGIRIELIFN